MQRTTYPMPNEFTHHIKTVQFNVLLDRPRNLRDSVARSSLLDSKMQRLSSYIHQLLSQRRTSPDCNGHRHITDEPFESDSNVQFDEITKLQTPIITNPMNDTLVNGNAGIGGKAPVTKKGADRPMSSDQITDCLIEFTGFQAGIHQTGGGSQDPHRYHPCLTNCGYLRS